MSTQTPAQARLGSTDAPQRTRVLPSKAGDAARDRIREGAARAVVEHGPDASMADIAATSGVSKALLHYHYTDRAHVLVEAVECLSARIVARERSAIATAPAGTAVDALWRWVNAELHRGELRALLELATQRDVIVQEATARAAHARRANATTTTTLLFTQLGLVPRVPEALLGDASVAFIDGLALDAGSTRDPRVSFDVFWLALLSLGE